MFENPRTGRQARNSTANDPKISRSQIVFRTDIFRKLTLGAPVFTLSVSFGFHGPPLLVFKTDRLDLRGLGLNVRKSDVIYSLA